MSGVFTKAMACNTFIGGSTFFLFLALSLNTVIALPYTTIGKASPNCSPWAKLWAKHHRIVPHTRMGEGAYFNPELADTDNRHRGRSRIFL